ncbi:MAG: metalloregulator ArsR/SmtB family transcription factor [Cyclobacteriaceae bacterium]|nr:metalloregulator ArsR/SmtB family transcription factor [Cyclobacteriaceae bacterium]
MRLKNFKLSVGSQIFKACAEEPRLRILHLLMKNKEMTISDLEQVLDFTQTKTSRHVAYLKNAGTLSFRKQEQWVLYSIKEEMTDILQQVLKYVEKDTILSTDQETYETLYTNRELSVNQLKQKGRLS